LARKCQANHGSDLDRLVVAGFSRQRENAW
jgi:hypothetical protein